MEKLGILLKLERGLHSGLSKYWGWQTQGKLDASIQIIPTRMNAVKTDAH